MTASAVPGAAPAAGSSFYLGMRILPKAKREAMFAIYAFCRAVDDIADDGGPQPERKAALARWREDIDALYRGETRPATAMLAPHIRPFHLGRTNFHDVIDGMEMDVDADIQAPDWETLDVYCDRVASAVGRLSARVFGLSEGDADALAHHLGRALQLTNILRDIDEDAEIDRLYLPREALERAGMTDFTPAAVLTHPGLDAACREVAERALRHYERADALMRRQPRRLVRAPRLMEAAYRAVLGELVQRGFAPPRRKVKVGKGRLLLTLLRQLVGVSGTIHVVGAGLAGLAAALRLADGGAHVVLYDAAKAAGGRCRSYRDATLGLDIDNGNHLLLSGNDAARAFLERVGGMGAMSVAPEAVFDFADLRSGERWRLRPNAGRLPWWILVPSRRVPGTRLSDYLAPLAILRAPPAAAIGDVMACEGALWERLWHPVLVAALNTEPAEATAGLAARILRETLGAGGDSCRPMVATGGLSAAFVAPALAALEARGADIRLGTRLRALGISKERIETAHFSDGEVALGEEDRMVLAVPAWVAAELLPGLDVPTEHRAIVNAHYAIPPAPGQPPLLGLVGGLTEWLFAYPDRVSVTISAADRLLDLPREELAATIWREIAPFCDGRTDTMPPWQLVREKRATFAATPAMERLRPGAATRLSNLALAGDWTATGLPATIEGAIRSGNAAADLLQRGSGARTVGVAQA